jgi:peptide chain release factor 1
MFKKLDEVEKRFEDINSMLQDPGVTGNAKKYAELMKEYSSLQEIVDSYRKYRTVASQLEQAKEMIKQESDEELRKMALDDATQLEEQIVILDKQLKLALLPKDPNDDKNIIVEIRGGAGGDEAALFVESLYSMYLKYANLNGWGMEALSGSPGNMGGFREIIFGIRGTKVFSKMKYESGVHRVQRVPKTETQGRIHTSTVTVAVLPEVEEVDIDVKAGDLKIDVFRSGGPGGQSVNTTDSAVRITHIPTGVVVVCQDEKSQLKNRAKALKILYARLYDAEQKRQQEALSEQRKGQIGTGDRSERIRTYNFPQGRVTDHRIGLTLYQIDKIINGELDEVIDPLITHYQAEALKSQ